MNNNSHSNTGSLNIHPEEKRWFAVYTRYKREKKLRDRLTEKGIETYLPLQRFTRYYTRKIRQVELPLISCYIFVRIRQDEYVRVLEDQDVQYFIKFEKKLVSIPEAEINLLRHIVGEGVELEISQGRVRIGQEAEIVGGRLTGLKGKVVAQKGEKNFVIELDQLRFNLHLQVPAQYLKPIGRGQQ